MSVKKYDFWIRKGLFADAIQDSTFSHTHENTKVFNINSNILAFLTVNPPTSRVAHVTRNFLTLFLCSYYSSMVELLFSGFRSLLAVLLRWFLDILKQLHLVKTIERQFWDVSAISCWRRINIDVCKTSWKGQIREFEESY